MFSMPLRCAPLAHYPKVLNLLKFTIGFEVPLVVAIGMVGILKLSDNHFKI